MFVKVRRPAALAAGFTLSMFLPIAMAWAGPAYMNDANTRQPPADPSVARFNDGYPRTLAHEFAGKQTNAEYSKYMFIAAKGIDFPRVEAIQSQLSPQTKMLRHISARAYQSWPYAYCHISGGVAFETTTAASQGGPSAAGCGIYAGHWLYKPGTKLKANIAPGTQLLRVENAARIQSGQYVVIYDAPAGSFRNAEHARVTRVDRGANTITVARGYKSTPRAHGAGAIVAQHVRGQGPEAKLWAFNMSSKSPRDAKGRTFAEFYAAWLGRNLLRYRDGRMTSANVAGVLLDADFYFDLKSSGADANNDLRLDNGLSPTGENWLGKGMDDFYRRLRAQLPGKYVITGHQLARGYETTHGSQFEAWLDWGNNDFNPNPKYRKVNEMFARYLYNMAERNRGPSLMHLLLKTPTRQYRGKAGAAAKSNAPFRMALTMALMEGGYFGLHSEMASHAWWDEYAVYTNPKAANFGRAVPDSNAAAVRANRGWLGQPTGKFERVYDAALVQPGRSIVANGTFDKNINGWRRTNVSISRDTNSKRDGTGSMRISSMNNYASDFSGAVVKSERISVAAGQSYTIAISLRSNTNREVRVSLGNDSVRLPLSPRWRRYVVTLRPTRNQLTALSIGVGMEPGPVWVDSVYAFRGVDANVFKREFQRGLAIANATPKPRTVVVGPGYRRIAGTQDPAVNNGQAVTQVTIPPYDGLVLIKTGATGGGTGGGGTGGTGGAGVIGDRIWRDSNGNSNQDSGEPGWSGVTVNLLTCSGNRVASTTSGSDGSYAFKNLGPGRYKVVVKAPSGTKFSPRSKRNSPTSSDVDPNTGESWCIDITSAGEKRLSIDAGIMGGGSTGGGRIGDYVWKDLNGDGIQNNSEPGMSGVRVKLRSCNGIWKAATTTSASGAYRFANLPLDKYLVEFVLPSGARFSPPRRGTNRGMDSDADPATGFSHCVDLKTQSDRRGIDAGIRP